MIQIKNVSFSYKNKPVLIDCSLEINEGVVCALAGKNGAGKTTLLRLMSGLLFTKNGKIDCFGHNPSLREIPFLEKISLMSEDFRLPYGKEETYLSIFSPFYPLFSYEQFYEYAKMFELPLGKNVSTFSYGEKKKFMLSFSLASGTPVIFLDEPTNGLDIPSKAQLRVVLQKAQHQNKIIIISSHQLRDLQEAITHLAVLENGAIQYHNDMCHVKETFQTDDLETVFQKIIGVIQ